MTGSVPGVALGLGRRLLLGLLADMPGLGAAAAVLPLALGVLVALEGPSLRAGRLRRRGYREAAVVEADDCVPT